MLTVEKNGRVAVATLCRPPVNALDDALIARLDAALDQIVDDDEVTVLHIRSGPDAMLDVVARMQRLFARIENAPLVTLAEIGGAALGGGMELALACDIRVAAAEATLGLPEARLGLLPGAGGTQRLARLCGRGIASRLILGAEVIDGAEAERLGIVQWSPPRAGLAETARDLAARFAALPRAALAEAKRCIAAQSDPARDGFAEELAASRRLYQHPETRRRVSEFLNRSTTQNPSKETS